MPEDKTTPTPVVEPTPAAQPVQQAPQTPIAEQYFTQPNAAPVQYVIQQRSLKGLGGWLLFFVVATGLLALANIPLFIQAVTDFEVARLADVIIAPLIVISAVAAITYTALEKKVAKNFFIGVASLCAVSQIIAVATSNADISLKVTGVILSLLWLFFVVLYFVTSKRVKETLVK